MRVTLALPYPPTVNHYYERTRGGGQRIGDRGLRYRQEVAILAHQARLRGDLPMDGLSDRLGVIVAVRAPDRRVRDLGNLEKCLFDALTHARVWEDDGLIDDQRFIREAPMAPLGLIMLHVRTLAAGAAPASAILALEGWAA